MSTWQASLHKFINREPLTAEDINKNIDAILEEYVSSDEEVRKSIESNLDVYMKGVETKAQTDKLFREKFKALNNLKKRIEIIKQKLSENALEADREHSNNKEILEVDKNENALKHPLNASIEMAQPRKKKVSYEERNEDDEDEDYELPSFNESSENNIDRETIVNVDYELGVIKTENDTIDLTEGLSEEDIKQGKEWAKQHGYIKNDNESLDFSNNESNGIELNLSDIVFEDDNKFDDEIVDIVEEDTNEVKEDKEEEPEENLNKRPRLLSTYKSIINKISDPEDLEAYLYNISYIEKNPNKNNKFKYLDLENMYLQYRDNKPKAVTLDDIGLDNPDFNLKNISFADISKSYRKEPDASLLRLPGSKIDKIQRYRESEINGRTLYLPDSNYEVVVKQLYNRSQISFLFTIMKDYVNIEEIEGYLKEEIVRILHSNCYFPLEPDLTYENFIKNLSPNDLELLLTMFAVVNSKEDEEGNINLEVDKVQCNNCGTIYELNESLNLDLKTEFTNIYDVEKFLKNFAIYKRSKYNSVEEAFHSGVYGQYKELDYQEGNTNYNIILSNPTVYKELQVKNNNEYIAYRLLSYKLQERPSYFKNTIENYDMMVNYLNSKTYTQWKGDIDFINKNTYTLDNIPDEYREMYLSINSILEQLPSILQDLEFVFYASLVIDRVKIEFTITEKRVVTETVEFNLNDEGDIFNFVRLLQEYLPQKLITEIGTKTAEFDYEVKDTTIYFEADEMKDSVNFYSAYRTDDEIRKVLEENGSSEATIQKVIDDVHERLIKFQADGRCPKCDAKYYKVRYNDLLFFSMTNLLN